MSNSKRTAVVRAVLALAFSLPIAGAAVAGPLAAAVLAITPASVGAVIVADNVSVLVNGITLPPGIPDPDDLIWQTPPKPPTT